MFSYVTKGERQTSRQVATALLSGVPLSRGLWNNWSKAEAYAAKAPGSVGVKREPFRAAASTEGAVLSMTVLEQAHHYSTENYMARLPNQLGLAIKVFPGWRKSNGRSHQKVPLRCGQGDEP
jgi:hypothetical protein